MSQNNELQVLDICKKLKPLLGEKADKLFLEYSLADSVDAKQEIYHVLIILYSKYVDDKLIDSNIIIQSPPEGIVDAEYELGKINYPNKDPEIFGLREKDWIRHVCISGMSGSGKTTFALKILHNFINVKKPFIVFDWKKSFRPLVNYSEDIMFFTVGKAHISNLFRVNLTKPPKNVSIDEWIMILCDLLCECYGASYGVHKLLVEFLHKAYSNNDCYNGSKNYPTFYDVKKMMEAFEKDQKGFGRQSEWLVSALRIVNSLTFGEFGQTINDKSKYNPGIEELLENQIVFELDGLGVMEKKFFCSYLLMYLYKYNKANSHGFKNKFKLACLVDEAHNIFLKEKPSFIQESITEVVYREIREYGVSLICLDQHVSKLSETVMGNSSVNIAFQQILPRDVETVARLMFLTEDRSIFTKIKVGEAIVKLTDRYFEPFLINVEMIKGMDKDISDKKIREMTKEKYVYFKRKKVHMEKLDNKYLIEGFKDIFMKSDPEILKVIKEKLNENVYDFELIKKELKFKGYSDAQVSEAFENFNESSEGKFILDFVKLLNDYIEKICSKIKVNTKREELYKSCLKDLHPLDLLQYLVLLKKNNGSLPTTKIYKMLNLSMRKGNGVKNKLLDLGLVFIHEEKSKQGVVKYNRLTDEGMFFADKIESSYS